MLYQKNPKIKAATAVVGYTQDEIDEIKRCRDDIFYFMENYVKIVSMDKGMILFEPYQYQKNIISNIINNRYSIFLLPRQFGKTITVAATMVHHAIFNDNARIAILANKAAQSAEIMARIRLIYEELPFFLQPGVSTWNKGNIVLGNRSEIFGTSTTSSSIRGKSINCLYLDEFAFVPNDVEFYASTYPVITSGKSTKVIITSTPNGMNLFYKLWSDAFRGDNSFSPLKVNWWEHPERDETWKEEQLLNMTEKEFAQEFLCEFLGSSSTLISGQKLIELRHEEPLEEVEGGYKIFEKPQENRTYVLVADSAEGIGYDYSAIKIIDVTSKPFKTVLTYRNNTVTPVLFSAIINDLHKKYNEALVLVENNGVGAQVCIYLWEDLECENMLMSEVRHGKLLAGSGTSRSSPGLRMTARTKSIGCITLKQLIEMDMLIDKDFDTISEFSTFIKKANNTYSAEKNKNDDLVMCLVLFAWLTNQEYFDDISGANFKSTLFNDVSSYYHLPIIQDDGIELTC